MVSSPNWIGATIDCGLICKLLVITNRTMVLTAMPSTYSVFTGWEGACSGTDTTCTVTMDSSKEVYAHFTSTPPVTVMKDGDGEGTVTSEPAGIDCGATCSATFMYETVVTLTAASITGTKDVEWSGECAPDGLLCITTATRARDVTATFNLITTDLSISQTATRSTGLVTFTVVATNNGPVDANGTIISDTLPQELLDPQWSCVADNGAACPTPILSHASATGGTGNFSEVLPAFPNGGVVTYTIWGGVGLLTQRMTNLVEVIPPSGVTDKTQSNNLSELITEYRVMFPIVLSSNAN